MRADRLGCTTGFANAFAVRAIAVVDEIEQIAGGDAITSATLYEIENSRLQRRQFDAESNLGQRLPATGTGLLITHTRLRYSGMSSSCGSGMGASGVQRMQRARWLHILHFQCSRSS